MTLLPYTNSHKRENFFSFPRNITLGYFYPPQSGQRVNLLKFKPTNDYSVALGGGPGVEIYCHFWVITACRFGMGSLGPTRWDTVFSNEMNALRPTSGSGVRSLNCSPIP